MIQSACSDDRTLAGVAERLRFPPGGVELCTGWDEAMGTPPDASRRFFAPEYIAAVSAEVGLSDGMIATLIGFADFITPDSDVVCFFHYCRHRILNDPTLVQSWEEQWPPLDSHLGIDAGLLNVLVMLATVPEMRETCRKLGIPEPIIRDTVADLRRWMETDVYFQQHRRWGITPWIARWLCKHWQGKLLHLKRLQFSLGIFPDGPRAYRHRRTGQVVAISSGGIRYHNHGDAWGACCGDNSSCWTSILDESAAGIIGHVIRPDGHAVRSACRLDAQDWELALAPGDPVLTIHVPSGGPLTFDDCGESFRQALELFPRIHPQRPFKAFYTASWLLDTRLDHLLPEDANIVRLQRELYLWPGIQGDNSQVLQRVFGWGVRDTNALPCRTSLQRSVGTYLRNGGHFHGGFCFLLTEDFAWGSQPYRQAMAAHGLPA